MAIKVFKLMQPMKVTLNDEVIDLLDTVSSVEAIEVGVSVEGLPIASIEDLKSQVEKNGRSFAYMGSLEVTEGIYEFDFDENIYKEVKDDA